ncbi:MAG: alpha/beta fold hydrolase [Rhizobiales bacterium]|nr:alpha/beta fold hydrolase [Hyphomicrobiales bacterium]
MKNTRSYRGAILAGLAVLATCSALVFFRGGDSDSFYDASAMDLSGDPGSVIRSEPIHAFAGAKAWRVLYRSTGLNGEPTAVSGVMVAPDMAPPVGGYPVVAWAHPTTGVARKCAPSLDSGVLKTIPGLDALVKQGFVVTATDYAGLGTGGVHPYLVGLSAGRSVLDSVRAARSLTNARNQFAVWGHSQGGHAALWTGQLASGYALDLKIVGVAAAAPASELASLVDDDLTTPAGQAFTALALLSWSRIYGTALDTIIAADALTPVGWIGAECMTNRIDLLIDDIAVRTLKKRFLRADPVNTEPWKNFIIRNTPAQLPPNVPLLIAQGRQDSVVPPSVTHDFATKLCQNGSAVQVTEMNADHLSVTSLSAGPVVEWIADRFAGKPAPSTCTKN